MEERLKNEIRSFVEWQLRNYQENKRILQGQNTYANRRYRAQIKRCVTAIDDVLKDADHEEIELISMVYWKQTHTVTGASMELNISRSTAYRYQERILKSVAKELGYIN